MIRFASLSLVLSAAFTTAVAQTKTAARPIINGGAPLVSPSAPVILFESNRSGRNLLYIMNADGSGQRQLTPSNVDVSGAQWLPGGKSVLYSTTEGDESTVYELWPDGGQTRMLRKFPGRSPR